MSIGFRGNNAVIMPGLGLVLASLKGNWGDLDAGNPDAPMNRRLRLLAASAA